MGYKSAKEQQQSGAKMSARSGSDYQGPHDNRPQETEQGRKYTDNKTRLRQDRKRGYGVIMFGSGVSGLRKRRHSGVAKRRYPEIVRECMIDVVTKEDNRLRKKGSRVKKIGVGRKS